MPDVIAPDLRILFCGINPGLYSGAVGHHFARPGNRFWKVLHAAGLTPRLLSPFEEGELLELGLGITNLVEWATARADQLTAEELRRGAERLGAKVRRFRPRLLAVLGLTAYRTAFGCPAEPGPQEEALAETRIWALPNPSGLNAHYQIDRLTALFGALEQAARQTAGGDR